MFDVVGIDTPCVDLLCHIEKLPEPNESVEIIENSWQGGGKVATGIIAEARLGLKCAMIGAVGDDIYGKYCIDDFQKHRVNVDRLIVEEDKTTTMCVVLSDSRTNGRNILYKKGNAVLEDITASDFQLISQSRYLHIANWRSLHVEAAKYARLQGIITVLDADNFSPGLDDILPCINILIASEFVYQHYFQNTCYEENLKKFMDRGPDTVIFTLGEKGCVGINGEGFFRVPAYSVKVRDTVGAGDVFHGAYIYGLCQSWSAEQCARFASAVSAIKCTRIGGRAGIPTTEMVKNFMEFGSFDERQLDERIKYYERGIEYVRA